jgi:Protein of unknown function (DUF3710)
MFRRKQASKPAEDEKTADQVAAEAEAEQPGPRDVSDIDLDDGVERLDLGGLLLAAVPGREVRLQVDEASKAVQAVLVAGADGAVELRPFAAPRGGDLWGEIRPQLAQDMTNRGGTVEEREGPFGIELVGSVPVQVSETETATQPSRIVGINGARWLLRATFLGAPAVRPEEADDWEAILDNVIIRRGDQAMPVGDPLPLVLPPEAHRQE